MFRRIKHQFIAELSWWCWSSAMLLPRPAWQLLLRKVPTALGHAEPWLWWEGWVTLTIGQMVFTPISGMAFLKHLVMKIEAKWQNHGLIKLNESSTWILVQFSRESTRLQSPRWRVQGHTFSQLSMFFNGLLSSGTLTRGFMWKLPAVMLSWHGQAHPQLA